jgi:membrane protein
MWMYLIRILERMEDNHIFLSGAAIAFNTLLCFIPMVLIVFYVLGITLDSESAIRTIDSFLDSLELFPFQREQLRLIILGILREFIKGSHIAGIVGGIGLIWTSSALFSALRTVLNQIYHVKDTKNIVLSKLKDLAMISIVGIALILLTVLIYGGAIVKGVAADVFGIQLQQWIFRNGIFHVTSFLVSFLVFCVIFVLVPDKRLPVRVVALTSGIAAFLWNAAKLVFTYYMSNLWGIGKIYGPYAIFAAAAIWVYYSGITILFSAEVGEMYMERRALKRMFRSDSIDRIIDSIHSTALPFAQDRPDADRQS